MLNYPVSQWILKFASYKNPDDILSFIESGEKTIETRPYNPNNTRNYSKILPGDTLVFKSIDSNKQITKTATFTHLYKSLGEMIASEPISKILPYVKTRRELLDIYEELKRKWGKNYASKLEKYGIVAIGFK